MKKPNQIFFLIIFLLLANAGYTQDIQFGQVYNNPLYLNPAMAGISPFSRLMAYNRTQWYNLDSKYISYLAGGDHFVSRYNSGLGGYLLYDQQGSLVLKSYEVQLQYAYELVLSKTWAVRAGIQPGYVSRELDYSTLIFPDQLNSNGAVTSTQASVPETRQRVNYFDFSSGLMVYNTNWWGGIALHHLNRPNQSFVRNNSRLQMKISAISGYKIRLKNTEEKEISITPTMYYKAQGKSDQIDVGLYGIYNTFIASIWYRGIPGLKRYNQGLQNNESVIAMIGYKFPKLQVCYSFDYTVSKLAPAGTGGVHEISLIYYFKKNQRKKPMKTLPCPELTD
ncbi:MAG: type IX secretion system membrane protein PorP/SprF [Opitutaceae bacterium]|nr:type IX secretion system membrane protein PorP/SprF [Cytophagales bacterium]